MKQRLGLLLWVVFTFGFTSQAQQVYSRLSAKSIKIGEPVGYVLTAIHPLNTQVVFPDSGAQFGDWVILNKQVYNSVSNDTLTTDSARYLLSYFGNESVANLSLPVTFHEMGSRVNRYAPKTSVVIQRLIKPQDLVIGLRNEYQTQPMDQPLDMTVIAMVAAAVFIILTLINALLGRPAQRLWKRLLLFRRHRSFMLIFEYLKDEVIVQQSTQKLEVALRLWKKQIERLDGRPYTTFTTREMLQVLPNEGLADTLQFIDRAVYGSLSDPVTQDTFQVLVAIENEIYTRQVEVLKGG